jgi:hypothetical protein
MADAGAGAERLLAGSDRVALVRLEGQDGPLRYGAATLEMGEIATSTGPVDRMTLGAALLARYVSVWNLSRSTIDLRRDTAP